MTFYISIQFTAFLYSASLDYSSYLPSGQTYYIVATFNIDGYEKVYTSPTVTIK